jgi:hypothetical protein
MIWTTRSLRTYIYLLPMPRLQKWQYRKGVGLWEQQKCIALKCLGLTDFPVSHLRRVARGGFLAAFACFLLSLAFSSPAFASCEYVIARQIVLGSSTRSGRFLQLQNRHDRARRPDSVAGV